MLALGVPRRNRFFECLLKTFEKDGGLEAYGKSLPVRNSLKEKSRSSKPCAHLLKGTEVVDERGYDNWRGADLISNPLIRSDWSVEFQPPLRHNFPRNNASYQ